MPAAFLSHPEAMAAPQFGKRSRRNGKAPPCAEMPFNKKADDFY